MVRLLCAFTLIFLVTLCLAAAITLIGLFPMMLFEDAIGGILVQLGRRMSE